MSARAGRALTTTAGRPRTRCCTCRWAWPWTKPANVYIADTGDNTIRKVIADGIINMVAGDSYASYDGDGGSARWMPN